MAVISTRRSSSDCKGILLTLLCVSLISAGDGSLLKEARIPSRPAHNQRADVASLQPLSNEAQADATVTDVRGTKEQRPRALQLPLVPEQTGTTAQARRSEWVQQTIPGGGLWSDSWIWQVLTGSGGKRTYSWQGIGDDELQDWDWDDREDGSSPGKRRRLKDITIPHIIHQVFLDGEAALEEEERMEERAGREFRRFNHRWRNSCQKFHPGWKHMFWDNEAAELLLLERYPWFLDTWRSYPRVVHRGDAIRPFLLHAYGGLYMDVDVECFDATDKMIDGFDLVLQLEDSGNKSLNNAVMAGAPGLEIWATMHGLLQQRAPHLVAMHNKTRSQRDMSHAVLYATGPWLLRDAFKEFSGDAGDLAAGYAGAHTVKGTHVMVYALGQWFEPCEWSDLSCHALVDIAAVSGTPLRGIVGHHKNAGTWLKGYSDAEAAPLSLQLRLKLRADTWATLAMGAALLMAMAALLCARIFRRRRRWRNSTSAGNLAAGGHRRVTSLNSFSSLASLTGQELVGLERRAMSYGSKLSSLGSTFGSSKPKLARPTSQQKFSILSEIEKEEL